jgi:hypothetical protein
MSARSPRRTFAAPLVVTVAAGALGACIIATKKEPARIITTNDGSAGNTANAGSNAAVDPVLPPMPPMPPMPPRGNPPPPRAPLATRAVADRDYSWIVSKNSDGSCVAAIDVQCPTGKPGAAVPTCNPPPPMATTCPESMQSPSIKVVQFKGSTTCMIQQAATACPPNTMCNPPPPTQVACPQ